MSFFAPDLAGDDHRSRRSAAVGGDNAFFAERPNPDVGANLIEEQDAGGSERSFSHDGAEPMMGARGSFGSSERSDQVSVYRGDHDSDAMSYGSSFYAPGNAAVRERRPWGRHRRPSDPFVYQGDDIDDAGSDRSVPALQESVGEVEAAAGQQADLPPVVHLRNGGPERRRAASLPAAIAGVGAPRQADDMQAEVQDEIEAPVLAQVPAQAGVGVGGGLPAAMQARMKENRRLQAQAAHVQAGIADGERADDRQASAREAPSEHQQRPAQDPAAAESGVEFQPALPGGRQARANSVPFERLREAGQVLQRRIGPDYFWRRGRYPAAVGTALGQTALRVGQFASGASTAAAVAASGGGALVAAGAGLAGESGVAAIAGAAGSALALPEQRFAGTQEGKLAAAQARRDEWNAHYLGLGENGEQAAQPRREAVAQRGVRFAERGDSRITGEQTLEQRVGDYATPTTRMAGGLVSKLLKGVRNKLHRFAGWVTRGIRGIGRNRAPGQRPPATTGNRAAAALNRLRPAEGEGAQLQLENSARGPLVEEEGNAPLIGEEGNAPLVPPAPAADDPVEARKEAWKSEFAPLRDHWSAPKAKHGAKRNIGFWRGQVREKLKEDYADLPTRKEHNALSAGDRAELFEREQLAVAPKVANVEESFAALQAARGIAHAAPGPSRLADEGGLDDRIRERGDALNFVDAVNERRNAAKVFHTLGGSGNRAAASALNRQDRAARRALDPLISRVDPAATPDNGKQGSMWKAMAGELNGDAPDWPRRNSPRRLLVDGGDEMKSPGDGEAGSAPDGLKAGSGLQTAGQVMGLAQHVEQVRRLHGVVGPIGEVDRAIGTAVPVFPLVGAASSLASGLLGTSAAYQNRHADPTLTSTEEQRNVASSQEALGKRRAQFAEDQKLKADGNEVPAFGTKGHGTRMFQAMVSRVKANTALEKAQTGAGINTLDEYTMKQSQGLMVDPARAQETAQRLQDTAPNDPRLAIARDELEVRNILYPRRG